LLELFNFFPLSLALGIFHIFIIVSIHKILGYPKISFSAVFGLMNALDKCFDLSFSSPPLNYRCQHLQPCSPSRLQSSVELDTGRSGFQIENSLRTGCSISLQCTYLCLISSMSSSATENRTSSCVRCQA
jgi:hypothetical protein